ncbi:helix-turn-helix domain-containing protein, partial [Acinetobacter baumannii]|uniref:helix-turn-helix domain-containing protein n=1 Tax=Acinetobacter baumannii TaxID=470 RepID=UPI0038912F7F
EHRGSTYNTWLDRVIKECESVNHAFLEPLPYSEIKATAKSIAKYCWKNDAYCYQEFIDRQSRKGKNGAKVANEKGVASLGGQANSDRYLKLRIQAKILKEQGYNKSKIAEILNVSRPSVHKWLLDQNN